MSSKPKVETDEYKWMHNQCCEAPFSKQDWKEVYKLSEETFVDESDSLKKTGAGAGLTDND